MNFREYQQRAAETDQNPNRGGDGLSIPVLGLAGEVGTLTSEYKKKLRDGDAYRFFPDVVAQELGDVLWYTATIASKLGLSLDDIATRNLEKTRGRWLPHDTTAQHLDEAWPIETERLPRHLLLDFKESEENGRTQVTVSSDGRVVGNALTDNAHIDDGYRFHDVFHASYMAVLGWSPVMRRNLGVKRKSNPLTDEVEDGGRAIVTEEGVAAYVFSLARQQQFFANVTRLDFALLNTIKTLTGTFEARDISEAAWENAILQGFSVWREVVRHRGGLVQVDMQARKLTYASV